MPAVFGNKITEFGDRWMAPVLLFVALAASGLCGQTIFQLPGSFSLNRLVLIIFPVLTGLLCSVGLVLHVRHPDTVNQKILSMAQGKNSRFIEILIPTIWLGLLIVSYLSPESLGRWWALYVRICPVFRLFFLIVSELWILWLYLTRRDSFSYDKDSKQAVLAGAIFAACFLMITLLIVFTGKGIGLGTQFWGKSGVPILHWQWLLSWLVMLFWVWMEGHMKNRLAVWQKDLAIFLLLWVAAFCIWQNVPEITSRYVTAAYPPNYAHYPYSDAAEYAIQAEAIRVGNGFPYGFIDKPLHLSFLAMLRWMAGSDYSRMIWLQVGFLALMPGLIYLLGLRIVSRPAGLLAGLAVLFMQANNLAVANRIQATNVKMAMSESLTAFSLILFCLSLVHWWSRPDDRFLRPALAGAMLGLSGLVRLNVLIILPFVLIVYLIASGWKRRAAWITAAVFMIFCLVPLVPWGIRNQIVLNNPLSSYLSKTVGVVFKERFLPILRKTPEPVPATNTEVEQTEKDIPPADHAGLGGLLDDVLHTGMHNLVTISLVLPASASHTSLDETMRLPYWDQEWDGTFAPGGQVVLAVSLLLVASGFAFAWKRNKIVSLIPLIVLIPYLLANGLSLVSGGRYIHPVDWVLPLYFAMGVASLTIWISGKKPDESKPAGEVEERRQTIKTGSGLVVVILLSCLPAVLSLTIPKMFLPTNNADVLSKLRSMDIPWPDNISLAELEEFSQQKDASFKSGLAVFPRWMKSGESDTAGAGSAYSGLPFDHLSFSVISDDTFPFDAVLPVNTPVRYLPSGTEVIIVGCKTKAYFDAILVVPRTDDPIVYARPDVTTFTCPLPTP
ncbi:MAG: glycosyltransferase family 39 protein [Leptolinea sp.]|jgi:hypothetical protein|nr:glycosyltransferase family 39 protein [Leptolinea sp.]